MYGIFLTLGEFGPGNCLGLLASKTSPTAVRGQFYGIAAAIGKVGAFVGSWVFIPIINGEPFPRLDYSGFLIICNAIDFGGPDSVRGNTGPFWIASGLAIFSALIIFFFIKPLTADGMTAEDIAFRAYLVDHGYDISQMGLHDTNSSNGSFDEEKVHRNEPITDEKAGR